jgi:hypothetical protein
LREYNILVFPCGTEIANEIINSLENHKYFKTIFASSEGMSFCNFRNKKINILPFVTDINFVSVLNTLIETDKIDFIIPAHDDVAYELSFYEDKLKCKVIGQSININKIVRFKDKTYDYFKNILPIAKIFNDKPSKNEFPVFVKPIKGQGALNAVTLNNEEQFISFFKQHLIEEFVIMEELTGKEFTIDCFSNEGKVLYSGARTRDKMTRGIAVLSSFVNDKVLNDEFNKFAKIISTTMKMHGIWFFQMKYDKQHELKLLEVGPRVPGSMMLNRARGVNFIELSIYQSLGFNVDIIYNNIDISLARALVPKYKHNIKFNKLYIDFDDTLFLEENKINTNLMKLIFDAKNDMKKVVLITKNKKNNLTKVLHYFGLLYIFDDIIHISEHDMKINYMEKKSLLVDDSYIERKNAINNGHYAIGIDLVDIIY